MGAKVNTGILLRACTVTVPDVTFSASVAGSKDRIHLLLSGMPTATTVAWLEYLSSEAEYLSASSTIGFNN